MVSGACMTYCLVVANSYIPCDDVREPCNTLKTRKYFLHFQLQPAWPRRNCRFRGAWPLAALYSDHVGQLFHTTQSTKHSAKEKKLSPYNVPTTIYADRQTRPLCAKPNLPHMYHVATVPYINFSYGVGNLFGIFGF